MFCGAVSTPWIQTPGAPDGFSRLDRDGYPPMDLSGADIRRFSPLPNDRSYLKNESRSRWVPCMQCIGLPGSTSQPRSAKKFAPPGVDKLEPSSVKQPVGAPKLVR
ncbi:MAG: hypothetical protein Ct9H300mP26_5800 [Acidimicrobiales bacterium]|nr:MAG: hypothetical protein Ct9H300mP26_5800 [Acidimicrobiales bacterium]